MTVPTITLYRRRDCHLCEVAEAQLLDLAPAFGFAIRTADVDAQPALRERYGQRVPVVALGDSELLSTPFDAPALRAALMQAFVAESDPPAS